MHRASSAMAESDVGLQPSRISAASSLFRPSFASYLNHPLHLGRVVCVLGPPPRTLHLENTGRLIDRSIPWLTVCHKSLATSRTPTDAGYSQAKLQLSLVCTASSVRYLSVLVLKPFNNVQGVARYPDTL